MWSFFHHHFFCFFSSLVPHTFPVHSFIFIIFHFRFTSAHMELLVTVAAAQIMDKIFPLLHFFIGSMWHMCVWVWVWMCLFELATHNFWACEPREWLFLFSSIFFLFARSVLSVCHSQRHPITMMWWFFYFIFFFFYHLSSFDSFFFIEFFMLVNDDGGVIIAYAFLPHYLCSSLLRLGSKCNSNMLYFFASANTFSFLLSFFSCSQMRHIEHSLTVIWAHTRTLFDLFLRLLISHE